MNGNMIVGIICILATLAVLATLGFHIVKLTKEAINEIFNEKDLKVRFEFKLTKKITIKARIAIANVTPKSIRAISKVSTKFVFIKCQPSLKDSFIFLSSIKA